MSEGSIVDASWRVYRHTAFSARVRDLINRLLSHPLTRDLAVDDPRTTALRRQIIRDKPFLEAIYKEWYQAIIEKLSPSDTVLELGSGAGFIQELRENVITSEVFVTPGIDLVADGRHLPISDGSLDAIVLTDVLHHIPNVDKFFENSSRCIKPGGKLLMIEPWRTKWSQWVYQNIHSEPFNPNANWDIPSSGPLSGANGALPWIIFERDREEFETRFPEWKIKTCRMMMPISYILSGGVSMRSLVPGFAYKPIRTLEKLLERHVCAMFAFIEIVKETS